MYVCMYGYDMYVHYILCVRYRYVIYMYVLVYRTYEHITNDFNDDLMALKSWAHMITSFLVCLTNGDGTCPSKNSHQNPSIFMCLA